MDAGTVELLMIGGAFFVALIIFRKLMKIVFLVAIGLALFSLFK